MSIIKILPENLVNQIAAGEVVERPASVVKELLENCIDAGATRITLEVQGAGDETLKITDNGSGMSKEDALLAFERHATSKISKTEDLFSIQTMGFRGEAIASIASVSHTTLMTKRATDDIGTKITNIGGKIEKIEECSCPDGTQIEVKNLFYNTPARKKYLKTPSTEYQHILHEFQEIALSNPQVHFSLVHDDKASLQYPKTTDLIERIRSVLGKHTAENCIPIFYKSSEIEIEGYIGKPDISRSGTKHQHLFVNNRHINHHLFSYALAQSYHSMLMERRKPFFAINIKISPELIDVNVHPRKLEIRFLNQSHLFSILQKAAKASLEKYELTPNWEQARSSFNFNNANTPDPEKINHAMKFTSEFAKGDSPKTDQNFMPGRLNKYSYRQDDLSPLSMVPLAQIAKSYILAENDDGLVLIDQHAAHERVKYEEFMNQLENKSPEKQQLLIPQNLELSLTEAEIIFDNLESLKMLGFEIEHFGGNTFIIHAVPASIAKENIEQILMNTISDFAEEKKTNAIKNPQEKIIEYMACRSAIKFGHDLSIDEMAALIRQMDGLKRPYTCPHGRPSMIKMSFDELEKRFRRK